MNGILRESGVVGVGVLVMGGVGADVWQIFGGGVMMVEWERWGGKTSRLAGWQGAW